MWCVACGDDVRLLPAATAAVSFTAQQHLSVVPASAVLTVGALGLLAATWRREGRWHDATSRRELRRWGAWSGLVALVLWAPVLAQQAFDDEGNLGQAVWFARHGNNETVGYSSAVWQLTHALGLPPLLGRTEVTGQWLLSRPTPFGWASAAAVVATVVALGWRWRGREPRRVALCAMAGVVAIAGLVNGSLVPASLEQYRLPFYHWTFVLALFVALVLGLAATDAVRGRPVAARPALVPVLTGLVVVAIAAPSLANPLLDRRTNTLVAAQATVERDVMDRLADDVIAHPDGLGDHPVLLARNEPLYAGISLGLAYELTERGVDLRHPAFNRFYVSDQRLADRDEIDGGIVVVVNDDAFRNAPRVASSWPRPSCGTASTTRAIGASWRRPPTPASCASVPRATRRWPTCPTTPGCWQPPPSRASSTTRRSRSSRPRCSSGCATIRSRRRLSTRPPPGECSHHSTPSTPTTATPRWRRCTSTSSTVTRCSGSRAATRSAAQATDALRPPGLSSQDPAAGEPRR